MNTLFVSVVGKVRNNSPGGMSMPQSRLLHSLPGILGTHVHVHNAISKPPGLSLVGVWSCNLPLLEGEEGKGRG